MIFVTVGTQLPFDRMVRVVDDWAGRAGRRDVLAQIGPSELVPQHIKSQPFLSPPEFARCFADAELVIAHAGMGSILSALSQGKPILIMPRRADLNEQRNDHQLATARRFMDMKGVSVAMDEQELGAELDRLADFPATARIGPHASSELLATVRAFIAGERTP